MDLRLSEPIKPAATRALLMLSSFAVLVHLVQRYDAPVVLTALLLLGVSALLLPWPEITTLVIVFLLYINIPAIAHQLHGVPKIVAGSIALLLALPLIHTLVVRREQVKFDPYFLLMLWFLGVLLLASLLAKDKSIALDRVLTHVLEGLVVYWLVINVVRRMPTFRRVIWTLLAAGSLLGSLSLYQSVTRSYDQEFGGLAKRQLQFEYKHVGKVAPGPKVYRADRADGPLVGNNRYAQIMIVLLPLAVLQFRSGRSRRGRLCAVTAGVLILSGIVLTYSRGALVTLAALIAIAAILKWLRPAHVLAGALCAVVALPFAAPNLLTRIETIGTATALVDEDPTEDPDGAIRGRATAMMAAFHVFLDHPILGVGPGQYVPYYSVEYQQIPEIKFRDIRGQRRAHSLYFEMAADVGLVGLLSFLAIPFFLLATLWRIRRQWSGRDPEIADIATAFFLSILAYLGTAVFLHLAFQRYYWLLLAVAGAAIHVIRAEAEQAGMRTDAAGGQTAAEHVRRGQPVPQVL